MNTLHLTLKETLRRLPPIWPLQDFVAVNPFLGLSDLHFLEAASLLRRAAHGDILLSAEEALALVDSGVVTDDLLSRAINQARSCVPAPWSVELGEMTPAHLRAQLLHPDQTTRRAEVLSVADALDRRSETGWANFITEELSKWCSVYFDEGQSSWRMPWRDRSFYTAWREAARLDANPRLNGLDSFDSVVRTLPEDPNEAIAFALARLDLPEGFQVDFLHRQLLSLSGWSAYAQYCERQGRETVLLGVLAARLAYDLAVWEHAITQPEFPAYWRHQLKEMQRFTPDLDLLPRYLVQLARELSYQRNLSIRLLQNLPPKPLASQPWVRAVFCIDVRSEVIRRQLEAQDAGVTTSGFAGFFGLPIAHVAQEGRPATAQLPVLFSPQYTLRETPICEPARNAAPQLPVQAKQQLAHAWNAFKTSAISCFSFVETMGLTSGWKLGTEAFRGQSAPRCSPSRLELNSPLSSFGIPAADQVGLAHGILRNLGLTTDFPRLVLFCGHGSVTNNNPYAAGLDCGACGGHSGRVNARAAALLLNQPAVRLGLRERGINLPEETYFLAGEHRTTTDVVELFDLDQVPPTHRADLRRLETRLNEAGRRTRQERAQRLGLDPTHPWLDGLIEERASNWAQVRPEWGLANNAALIAAPRARTHGQNLEGRTFLHDYESSRDAEGKVLELILTAPVVVANWISLQYYASTVNNRLYGSGNKTIHNVVGTLGIWQGNGGDLQTGLPWQSVHDGRKFQHEPLRLSVIVEATREAVDRVLSAHTGVRDLVRNEWLFLFVLEPGQSQIWQAHNAGKWTEFTAPLVHSTAQG